MTKDDALTPKGVTVFAVKVQEFLKKNIDSHDIIN